MRIFVNYTSNKNVAAAAFSDTVVEHLKSRSMIYLIAGAGLIILLIILFDAVNKKKKIERNNKMTEQLKKFKQKADK